MPLLGWLSGSLFESLITAIDHWIAFILLALIGGNMIREAVRGEDEDDADCNLALPHVLLLAVATSIDAFAIGITFAFLKVDILSSIAIIGVTTFVLCFAAVYLGSKLGSLLKKYAGILGGIILILIGTRILIEHLFSNKKCGTGAGRSSAPVPRACSTRMMSDRRKQSGEFSFLRFPADQIISH